VEKKIGKIQAARFGFGGYQDAMVGVSFTLGGREGWGVNDFWGNWSMKRDERCKWTEAERLARLGEMVMRLSKILKDANKEDVAGLVGVPVEATFDAPFGKLLEWRVLTEVI
jgi:hypothetical protein